MPGPIPISSVFSDTPAGGQPMSAGVQPGISPPDSAKPRKGGPISFASVFAPPPPKPSLLERGKAALGKVEEKAKGIADTVATSKEAEKTKKDLKGIGDLSEKAYNTTVGPTISEMLKVSGQYFNQMSEDLQQPLAPTAAGQIKQLAGVALDALGWEWSPVQATVDAHLVEPVKAGIQKLADVFSKHAADDVYDEQARRLGDKSQKYVKGVDWKLRKSEVQTAADSLKMDWEALVNARMFFMGGEKPHEAPTGKAVADMRAALRDVHAAVHPEEPELKPITFSLDKTFGFKGVTEKALPELEALRKAAPGGVAVLKPGQVLDTMIPHAEGYSKSFMEKLSRHSDPEMEVRLVARDSTELEERASGHFDSWRNLVRVRMGLDNAAHTIVHEIVHGNTIYMLDTLMREQLEQAAKEWGGPLSDDQIVAQLKNPTHPLIKELDEIIAEAKLRAKRAGLDFLPGGKDYHGLGYGLVGDVKHARAQAAAAASDANKLVWRTFAEMTHRYEFLSVLFEGDKNGLAQFLANSEKYASKGYKWKNIWNQFGDMIARHLGLKGREVGLLNQAMRVGSRLIEMQSEVKPPKHRGISDVVLGKLDNGEMITEHDVDRATSPSPMSPAAVREAEASLKFSIGRWMRAINPEALGQVQKLAAATISRALTRLEQSTNQWKLGSRTRQKFFLARPDLLQEFIDKFEKGDMNFSHPKLRKFALHYQEWNKRIFEQDAKNGINYEARENYLYHVFKDHDGVAAYFNEKYGTQWGDPKFIKDRQFDLYKEARAAGFEPRFTNPEDIMLARQHASDLAEMHNSLLQDLEKFGLATKKVEREERIRKVIGPDGKVQWEPEIIEGTKKPDNTTRWRSPNGDVYWVNNDAHQVMENAFLSYSPWSDKGIEGQVFRGMMEVKNRVVPTRLALSLFHPLHVVGIDTSAGWTRATSELLSGHIDPVTWAGKMFASGFQTVWSTAPVLTRGLVGKNQLGWRVMRAWREEIPEGELSAADAEALKILHETGIAPELSSQFKTTARQNFKDSLLEAMGAARQGRPLAAAGDLAKATFHFPFAALSALNKPIFEQWIPSLKAASVIRDAKSILARNPELMDNEADRLMVMRRVGKSVENRYGEMAYNKLFWKRWAKDIAVLDTLSLGWQLGFIREYGGGALDLGQWAKGEGKLARIKRGELDRALFVANYTVLGATVTGLMSWSLSGKVPEWLDYISPRSGEKNPDGSDARLSTMFYSREFASTYKHIQNEGLTTGVSDFVLNKGSGMFGLMHEMWSGMDRYGKHFRNPDSPEYKQLEQTLAYVMSDVEPISMRSIQQQVTEQPLKGGALSVLGFTPAPKYLTESVGIAGLKSAFRNFVATKETPFEKAEYSKDYSKLRAAYQKGEDIGDLLDKMSDQFSLTATDQRRLMKSLNSTLTPEQRMFISLGRFPDTQRQILDKMTPEEREQFLIHANKEHVRATYVPPEER